MKEFEYVRPATLAAAARAVREGAGTPIAGGTDLLGMMKSELIAPARLVDLAGLPELGGWRTLRGGIRLGAGLTLAEIVASDGLAAHAPILRESLRHAASPQLRNAGTLGGNLLQQNRCWYFRDEAVPCWHKGGTECFAQAGDSRFHAILGVVTCMMVAPSDLAPALIALDAVAELRSTYGTRRMPVRDLYQPPQEPARTELAAYPGEILVAVHIGRAALRRRGAFEKQMRRKEWSFATVSVAAAARVTRGRLRDARIVAGGLAAMPWQVSAAERALDGRVPDDTACREAADLLLEGARTTRDNVYKVQLTRELVRRALQSLVA